MKSVVAACILGLLLSPQAFGAGEVEDLSTPPKIEVVKEEPLWGLAPIVSTDVPIFLGAGAAFRFDSVEMRLQYGVTPVPYYQLIGAAAAAWAGNESYDSVIQAAFQNNHLIRADLLYRFRGHQGWKFGLSFLGLESKGRAEIDDVLRAATGRDFANLETLLNLAGRENKVDMNSKLGIIEAFGSYGFLFGDSWNLDVSLGIAKVIAADVILQTGLPNFEASQAGSTLMRNTERDLEDIIYEFGVSPTLGLALQYLF